MTSYLCWFFSPQKGRFEPKIFHVRFVVLDRVAIEGKEFILFNLLTPNVNYSGPTAPLTSKVAFYIFIQQI